MLRDSKEVEIPTADIVAGDSVSSHGVGRVKRSIVKADAAERSRRRLMRSPHVPNYDNRDALDLF